ncbi:hypothetical protein [Novosphingobium aerophilum]|nr:hypothetical protein [Novosphingobium aerophilum]
MARVIDRRGRLAREAQPGGAGCRPISALLRRKRNKVADAASP